ncbi:HtaA domain-containing protein [Nocardia sp. AG03]|uniref:HtaA domain-containing protein n=1 Tax=Nocardia sp. AG03 TaxID=3025312 RepID=UPI002418AB1A|nr:HtaA domain-containing protein [Nocardia sp. AG03]
MSTGLRWLVVGFAGLMAVGVAQAGPVGAVDGAPSIELFAADGRTPLGAGVVHPGDRIVVRGSGFDPEANTSGLPVPVPPGVPHGTFVTFGAFAPEWKPSSGAPTSARAADRSVAQWVLSQSALERIPQVPFDFQRTVRKQWVPLTGDGRFEATLTVKAPATTPADAVFGVYTYAAAESVNAAQELAVPVRFDPTPGPNTPTPPPADLSWAVTRDFAGTVTGPLQGSLSGTDGAAVRDGRLTYQLDGADLDPSTGLGTLRYRGTVVASTRFHLGEIALADPWIEFTPEGTWLSARTSTSDTIGADSLQRVRLARLDTAPDTDHRDRADVPVRFEPGIEPLSLRLLATDAAEPVDFRW